MRACHRLGEHGTHKYLLGTDDQGRDILSALIYGARILAGGGPGVGAAVGGCGRGPGPAGGLSGRLDRCRADAPVRRDAVVPAILVALLIAGVGRALFPNAHESLAFGVLIISISLTGWVRYAPCALHAGGAQQRIHVQAARVTGVSPLRIMRKHVLPNVLGPVMVLATIQVATAITEATLSFLGWAHLPSPSLGTLIRIGNDYLFSGEWWITVFPASCWC